MKRISIFLVIIGLTSSLHAQEVLYKVLACQGDAHIRKGMEARKVLPGASVFSQEELILSQGAYVALLYADGSTRELRGEMKLTTDELSIKPVRGSAWKYADFLMSKMTAEGKKNRLSNTGYLTDRGYENGQRLHVFIPSMVKVYNSQVMLRWPEMGNGEYEIRVSDMYESELLTTTATDNTMYLDLGQQQLTNRNIVLVKVNVTGKPEISSDTYALKRLSKEQSEEIDQQLESFGRGENAPDHLLRAAYFEENNLLADALTSYVKAMENASDVAAYKEIYQEFLLRNHLIRF